MKTIAPGIQQWSFFSQEKQLNFNGLLLTVNDHCILVDPPPMEAADRTAILKGHPVDYILLTNRDHVREAEACRRDFKAKVYAPEADAPLMEIPVDKTYKDGELLPGGHWVIHLKDMKLPGEAGLFLDMGKGYLILGEDMNGRQSGDRRALVATLGNLGNVCAVSGRREQPQQYYQEVLELQKVLGDERGIGTTLANLGNLRTDAGEWERARAYYLEALDLLTRASDEAALAVLYANLGLVARETGDYEQALAHHERSLTVMRRLGNQAGVADAYRMIGKTYALRKRYDDAAACALTSLGISRRLRDELRAAGAYYLLAGIREEEGKVTEAAELLERVVAIERKYHLPKLEENTRRLETLRERITPHPGPLP